MNTIDSLFDIPSPDPQQISALQAHKDSALRNRTCVNGHTGAWAVHSTRASSKHRKSPACRICKELSAKSTPARAARGRKHVALKRNQLPANANLVVIRKYYRFAKQLTQATGMKWHVDHVIPLSKGGLHHEGNLQVLPASVNCAKGNRIDDSIRGLVLQ